MLCQDVIFAGWAFLPVEIQSDKNVQPTSEQFANAPGQSNAQLCGTKNLTNKTAEEQSLTDDFLRCVFPFLIRQLSLFRPTGNAEIQTPWKTTSVP